MATATLLSQRARPRCRGRGFAWKALLEAVWHGFPASAATKRNEAGPPVSAPRPAHRTGGKMVVKATLGRRMDSTAWPNGYSANVLEGPAVSFSKRGIQWGNRNPTIHSKSIIIIGLQSMGCRSRIRCFPRRRPDSGRGSPGSSVFAVPAGCPPRSIPTALGRIDLSAVRAAPAQCVRRADREAAAVEQPRRCRKADKRQVGSWLQSRTTCPRHAPLRASGHAAHLEPPGRRLWEAARRHRRCPAIRKF